MIFRGDADTIRGVQEKSLRVKAAQIVAVGLFLLASGCRCNDQPAPSANAEGTAAAGAAKLGAAGTAANAGAANAAPARARTRRKMPAPMGTSLPILAGRGVGPIRIGATLATIERLMEVPCYHKTDDRCTYVDRAVEFELSEGITVRIHAHRTDRHPAFDAQEAFGIFNGGFTNGVRFGMHKHYVLTKFGEPEKKESVPGASLGDAEYVTVERHYYPGLILEYDLLQNGNTVLGGVVVTKAESPPADPKGGSE